MTMYDSYLEEIKAYNKTRDEMLLKCDVDALIAFMKERGLPLPSSRASAECTLHKTRTGVVSLPMEERVKSKKWLDDRGFRSLDDGELTQQPRQIDGGAGGTGGKSST